MTVEYICDGCGNSKEGGWNYMGNTLKPHSWFSRVVEYVPEGYKTPCKKTQYACSRNCLEKLGGLVAPW